MERPIPVQALASTVSFPAPAEILSEPTLLAARSCSPAVAESRSTSLTRLPPRARLWVSRPVAPTVKVSESLAASPAKVTDDPESETVIDSNCRLSRTWAAPEGRYPFLVRANGRRTTRRLLNDFTNRCHKPVVNISIFPAQMVCVVSEDGCVVAIAPKGPATTKVSPVSCEPGGQPPGAESKRRLPISVITNLAPFFSQIVDFRVQSQKNTLLFSVLLVGTRISPDQRTDLDPEPHFDKDHCADTLWRNGTVY